MANQNYLVKTNGIGADPSGTYSPISGGWEKSIASGVATWLPTGPTNGMGLLTDNLGATIIADTGEIAQTDTKTSATTGFTVNGGGDDTYQIQGFPSGATIASASLSMVVSVNSGTDSTSTFNVAHAAITSVSAGGLVTFSGTGGFASNFEAVITYTCDIDEPAQTVSSAAIPVTGVKVVNLYAPASGHAEIGVKWEWTADDVPTSGTDSSATWTQFAAYAANSAITAADHTLNNKAKYIRLSVLSTDVNIDGVIEANAVLGHETSGAKATWAVSNDASNNKPIVALGSESTAGSIGGIGADPS